MEINRKRVAKRLASGLMAGALALGGLAISGSSPAGATAPDWDYNDRIAGEDRYSTAIAIASEIDAVAPFNNLVIASGETPYDALASATLAGDYAAPILLVKKDSIPGDVADYLDDISGITGDVFIVGGESAISADVEDEIIDTFEDADVTRLAGANRYETAAEIAAEVVDSTDLLLIVNGADGRWADALSAGPLAATSSYPIVVTGNGGLNDEAKATIDDYIDANGSLDASGNAGGFVIIGGTSVLPTSVEDYLYEAGVLDQYVRRIGGSDRYGTNLLVNMYMLSEDYTFGPQWLLALLGRAPGVGGETVALASGEAPWDALTSAPWASASSSHVLLTNSSTLNGTAAAGLSTLADLESPQILKIIGGRNAVSDSVRAGALAAVSTDIAGPSMSGCVEGSDEVTLDFPATISSINKGPAGGNPAAYEISASWYLELGGVDYDSTDADLANDIEIVLDATAVSSSDLGILLEVSANPMYPEDTHITIQFAQGDAATAWNALTPIVLAEDDVVTFVGQDVISLLAGLAFPVGYTGQFIDETECVVAEDDVDPVLTLSALNSATETWLTIAADEPIVEAVAGASFTVGGAPLVPVGIIPASLDGSKWIAEFAVQTSTITVGAGSFEDRAGNASDQARIVPRSDSTKPSLTAAQTVCIPSASAQVVIDDLTVKYANELFGAFGVFTGSTGNDWSVEVVSERGLDSVGISVDGNEKLMTITIDDGYHDALDVIQAARNAGLNGWLGSWTFTSAGPHDVNKSAAAALTGGKRDCYTYMVLSEVAILDSTKFDVSVDGAPVVATNILAGYYLSSTEGLSLAILKLADVETNTGRVVLSFDTGGLVDPSGNSKTADFSYNL